MRKHLAFLLAMIMLLSMAGCASAPAASETAAPETAAPETVEETAAPETEATQPLLEGNLYLKVSSVTFSLVGESDNIYLGVIPADQVTWVSEDPSVISVENGVLTAVGVGKTTIHASYGDREVSCEAGCLAQTQEELDSLDREILSAPKRLPPEVDLEQPCTYFDDAVMLGDSITFFLMQTEAKNDGLGKVTFLTRNGISIHGLVLHSKNLYFEGQEMFVEDIISKIAPKRVYILLGCLDFQVPASKMQLIKNWNILLDRLEDACPDMEIVVISNTPGFSEDKKPTEYNEAVTQAAPELYDLAVERGYGYLDLGYYIEDHYGRMAAAYTQDQFHMNPDGSTVWMKVMRHYAQFEQEGGSLSAAK